MLRCSSLLLFGMLLVTPTVGYAVSFTPLGHFPGGVTSRASDVSADGLVVVGTSGSSNGSFEAFRWTSGGGMVGLGELGRTQGVGSGVSADGSVVTGESTTSQG